MLSTKQVTQPQVQIIKDDFEVKLILGNLKGKMIALTLSNVITTIVNTDISLDSVAIIPAN